MDFIVLIKKKGYLPLSFELCNVLGLRATAVLTLLIQKYLYLKEKGKLINGKFYCSEKDIVHKLGISVEELIETITFLSEKGLLDYEYKGYHFFTLHLDSINFLFGETVVENNYLSENTRQFFKELYNKNLPLLTQKKLLDIIFDEEVIQEAIKFASMYSPTNVSYLFKLLKDWKDKGLTSIEKVNAYFNCEGEADNLSDSDVMYINNIISRYETVFKDDLLTFDLARDFYIALKQKKNLDQIDIIFNKFKLEKRDISGIVEYAKNLSFMVDAYR